MKRRSVEANKRTRPVRKIKIAETVYSPRFGVTDTVNGVVSMWPLCLFSSFSHVKLCLVWILIMALDFALEFRIEFVWPIWLLLRSCVDSFRYQGLVYIFDSRRDGWSIVFVLVWIRGSWCCLLGWCFCPILSVSSCCRARGCCLQPVTTCGCSWFGIQVRSVFMLKLWRHNVGWNRLV